MEDRTENAIEPELAALGERLRALRSARGWTLVELAERSGLSKPFLSRLESGDRYPSIAAVLTLARVFDVPMGSLFEPQPADESCIVLRASDTVSRNSNGVSYIPLSIASQFKLQPVKLVVSASRKGDERFQHEGEEWLMVVSGRLRLLLGEKEYALDKGDTAHFDATLPHRLEALDGSDAQVILVACPIPTTLNSSVMSHRQTAGLSLKPDFATAK